MSRILDYGEVELINHCASDESVLRAMLVSTGRDQQEFVTGIEYPFMSDEATEEDREQIIKNRGRINYLMKNKHGTPFEHNFFCFRVKAPIFVIREWHRHRIGWSYNEQSGRYMQLANEFYVPSLENIRQRVGKPGAYTYEQMNPHDADWCQQTIQNQCDESYELYEHALGIGLAPEQARLVLHVNHYSSFYASCNARSLMKFLELRNSEQAQWEIQQYAQVLEDVFHELMPATHQCFVANGRIAP